MSLSDPIMLILIKTINLVHLTWNCIFLFKYMASWFVHLYKLNFVLKYQITREKDLSHFTSAWTCVLTHIISWEEAKHTHIVMIPRDPFRPARNGLEFGLDGHTEVRAV